MGRSIALASIAPKMSRSSVSPTLHVFGKSCLYSARCLVVPRTRRGARNSSWPEAVQKKILPALTPAGKRSRCTCVSSLSSKPMFLLRCLVCRNFVNIGSGYVFTSARARAQPIGAFFVYFDVFSGLQLSCLSCPLRRRWFESRHNHWACCRESVTVSTSCGRRLFLGEEVRRLRSLYDCRRWSVVVCTM